MLSDFLGSLGSIALAALGIGFLIFIHEAGHFLAARAAGVRVEVFSLGFGPRIWGFRKGPTDYRLSALPIGGYVLVAGADPSEPPKRKDDLVAKGFFARATFYSGGIVMNALFSMLAFAILFKVGVPLPAPVLGQITEGGAAWQAGLEEGDRILSVDGETIRDFNALRLEIALSDSENDTNIVVERAEEQFTAQLRPEYSTALGFRDLGASPALEDAPLVVQDVDEDSPAKAAGLNSGDAIIGINGTRATGFELYEAYGKAFDQPGEVSLALQLPNDNVRTITFETRALENTPKRLGVAQARDQVRA
ncbi:MAG: RIP metalloprotease RseP, partial [Planctomycetota bacterium]